ncbi:Cystathionine gamma-synthase 1, chloroplastic [Vitis vinifera]|uniref:plant cystathionine gamma-synthase n=1 Tax=Vitis vinifera TaxID=29760 RepID=A0A438D4S5_VITVI|nr:Cystathionine gamma-synthase 1, chloroplastic [Vitis vinifera]
MAVSSCPRVSAAFECRSEPDFCGGPHRPEAFASGGRFSGKASSVPSHQIFGASALSSLIFRFPPNFVRQLSTKARRNCSNIGVAQVVAASWSADSAAAAAASASAAAAASVEASVEVSVVESSGSDVQYEDLADEKASFLGFDGPLLFMLIWFRFVVCSVQFDGFNHFHGHLRWYGLPQWDFLGRVELSGERLGRGIVTDAITTPVVNTSAYFFKKTAELIDFKEKRRASFEYGRYGNPTTVVLEEKISALEGAESTVIMASGMCASTVMLLALVPPGGHMVTTTDCYRRTRIFIETFLPKLGVEVTVIDPADTEALKSALDKNNVTLFFTESPTNPFLRCVDIELVSELCHRKGALVCIDSTFATPLNQKTLSLGADLVLHSATKYIAGHNDVGCISGSEKLVSTIRNLHHVLGGVLNPNAAYLIIRGMKTLHLRVQQQNSTALRMAKILEAHPKVKCVYYPGLPSHPEHHIAKRQMTGFGGVVSFEVDGDLTTTIKFVDALKIPYIAPSFGGCESIVDQPAIMSYWDLNQSERAKYGIQDNLVRFSFGVEDFEDLKADILQALESI